MGFSDQCDHVTKLMQQHPFEMKGWYHFNQWHHPKQSAMLTSPSWYVIVPWGGRSGAQRIWLIIRERLPRLSRTASVFSHCRAQRGLLIMSEKLTHLAAVILSNHLSFRCRHGSNNNHNKLMSSLEEDYALLKWYRAVTGIFNQACNMDYT